MSSLYPQRYIVVSLSSDKFTYCKSVWRKASAKQAECKGGFKVSTMTSELMLFVQSLAVCVRYGERTSQEHQLSSY